MRFEYLQPETMKEALALLDQYGADAKVLAGGTDLMLKIEAKVVKPKYVIDISGIAELNYIKPDGNKGLRIGSLATINDIAKSKIIKEQFPVLAQAAGLLGSMAIRNVATLGGNICNAAPSAENAPALICLQSMVKIVSPKGERVVPLEEFFTGPGATVLAPNEILVEFQIPAVRPNTRGVYLKHSHRGSIDLSTVGTAVVASFDDKKQCQDVRIALGAVAATPIRAKKAESMVKGKMLDEKTIEAAACAAAEDSCCITDVRASAEYRTDMVTAYTRRALQMVMPG